MQKNFHRWFLPANCQKQLLESGYCCCGCLRGSLDFKPSGFVEIPETLSLSRYTLKSINLSDMKFTLYVKPCILWSPVTGCLIMATTVIVRFLSGEAWILSGVTSSLLSGCCYQDACTPASCTSAYLEIERESFSHLRGRSRMLSHLFGAPPPPHVFE